MWMWRERMLKNETRSRKNDFQTETGKNLKLNKFAIEQNGMVSWYWLFCKLC